MNGRVSKAWARRSRAKLSKSLQETLLDTVASIAAGTELPPRYREQSPESGDLAEDATPVQARKRRLDATTESHPLAAKRARLTRTDAQQPGVGDKKAEEAGKTTLQQPKPNPPKCRYASFLKDFVDPVHTGHRPVSVHTLVSEWLVGLGREKYSRSDSDLYCSDDIPISRQLTRSAPEMGYTRDADGFAVPPTPASTGSRADVDAGSVAPSDFTGVTPGSGRSCGKSLVEDPLYRDMNLAANNIYMRSSREQFPEQVADLVNYVRRDRDSPGPSPDQVGQDRALEELGDVLDRADRQPMAKHTVPSAGSKLKVSTPVPNMHYGYNRQQAFPQQQAQLISMGTETVTNNQYQALLYPFFVVEFKGDGGSSASCVNVAEHLNRQLRRCRSDKVKLINSAAFSVAMNGSEARLYISWKHSELDYYMANVKSFLLQEPAHYLEFRKYVRNIIDWGKNKRLKEIRDSLDSLLEESRQRASMAAKSRQPPSNGSGTSSGKKRKSSSSRRNSSRSNSVQGQSGGANEPWEWDETTPQDAHGEEPSYPPQQLQSFLDPGDYTTPRDTEGPALPEYLPEDD